MQAKVVAEVNRALVFQTATLGVPNRNRNVVSPAVIYHTGTWPPKNLSSLVFGCIRGDIRGYGFVGIRAGDLSK